MSTHPPRAGSRDDDDLVLLLLIATIAGPGLAVLAWTSIVGWLVDHQVLVDAAARPLLVLPASDGAGLDLPRLLLLAALVLGALALLGSVFTRAIRSRRADVER